MENGTSLDMDVFALAQMRERSESHIVLDVREPWETTLCSLDGSLNIPMNEIPGRLAELPQDKALVVMCHHGIRSLRVAEWLSQNGFSKVVNLRAGIDSWARHIDPNMQTY